MADDGSQPRGPNDDARAAAAGAGAPHPFRSRRVWVLTLLGFSSGVPFLLTGQTLSAWMTHAKVDLTTIGLFALVALPYQLKWLWAPLLDRYRLPFLGRRRGWLLVFQLALAGAIAAMGAVEPRGAPGALAGLAVLVAFLSASQDIVVNAFTADSLRPDERAAGSALSVGGYRAAMLATGAASLHLAGHLPWRLIYGGCAALMLVGVLGTLLADEPASPPDRPATFADALGRPVAALLRRRGIVVVVAFVAIYRFGEQVAFPLMVPFLKHVGFDFAAIADDYQLLGFGGVVAGGVLGGWLIPRVGLRRSLLWFGAAGALTNLAWAALAWTGPSQPALVAAVLVDNLASQVATTAFVAYLLSLCDPAVSATQYALLTSLSSLAARLFGYVGAAVAARAGWSTLWIATTIAVLPSLVLLRWLRVDERLPPTAASRGQEPDS
ncbi:MAG TPA: MFS transporter [Kofleriaceae bacterium]|nr:MFS transporter [Kofleriaceae bacterium]